MVRHLARKACWSANVLICESDIIIHILVVSICSKSTLCETVQHACCVCLSLGQAGQQNKAACLLHNVSVAGTDAGPTTNLGLEW